MRRKIFLSILIILMSIPAAVVFAAPKPVDFSRPFLAVFRWTWDGGEPSNVGSCLPTVENADGFTIRNGIHFDEGDDTRSTAVVARLVAEAQKLAGGTFPPFRRFAVDVNPEYRIAGKQVFDSTLGLPKVIVTEPLNYALFAHEMGHIIGNTISPVGLSWYQVYEKSVLFPCHPTTYSLSGFNRGSRHEEFAEIVSAYLTFPELLLKKGAACGVAYRFFRTKVFPMADPSCLPKNSVRPAKRDAPPLPLKRPELKLNSEVKPSSEMKALKGETMGKSKISRK